MSQVKVYKEQGGDSLVVLAADGGVVKGQAAAGADPAQAAHIEDAKTDYATGDLDAEAEIIAAVNAANGKINAILLALERAGILAAS